MLESRHLVGLFLGVVLLCCVFFTLGYVMGRTQYAGSVHAAITPSKGPAPSPAASAAQQKPAPVAAPAPAPGEWDFYPKKGADAATPSVPVTPHPNQAIAETKSPPAPSKAPARFRPPQIPHGATILQLAALTRESDAMALADALQQKRFPAFVITPTADNLYRVQVGPYADTQSADLAKRSLEREGFKVIVKH